MVAKLFFVILSLTFMAKGEAEESRELQSGRIDTLFEEAEQTIQNIANDAIALLNLPRGRRRLGLNNMLTTTDQFVHTKRRRLIDGLADVLDSLLGPLTTLFAALSALVPDSEERILEESGNRIDEIVGDLREEVDQVLQGVQEIQAFVTEAISDSVVSAGFRIPNFLPMLDSLASDTARRGIEEVTALQTDSIVLVRFQALQAAARADALQI